MRAELHTLGWKILLGCAACALINPNVLASASYSKLKNSHNITDIRLITPFNASGVNPKIEISKSVSGNCWSTSSMNGTRPNTWRCQAEAETYDPCFINPIRANNIVICFLNPWDNKAVELKLSSPLPSNSSTQFSYRSAQPWALELADGNRCMLISGPSLHFDIGGINASYRCNKATVVGNIDRSSRLWKVMCAKDNELYMSPTSVITAWY